MTAQQRKEKTELYLKGLGIPYNIGLPIVDEEDEAIIRKPADIAKRIFVLAYLGVYAEDGDRNEIIEYLKLENIWDAVSDDEKELFLKDESTEQDKVNISWRSEAMYLMLWTINKIDKLDLPIEECSIWDTLNLLPDYLEPTKDFIANATIRTTQEILDETDLIYRLHWMVRQSGIENKTPAANINASMVMERHYALNWITYYDENWDEIMTDT
jgi:Domain of unknown function (DUF4272)